MSLQTVRNQLKYGLINKKKPVVAPVIRPKLNIFEENLDDDDDNDNNNNDDKNDNRSDIRRVNQQLNNKKISSSSSSYNGTTDVLDDPSIYDYDGNYDEFKNKEKDKYKNSSLLSNNNNTIEDKPKARYVNNLLTTAKMREKEKERVYEKQLLKERQIEDKEFSDKPKYMTAAYKKKLMEDKKWEYEDKLADEIEKNTDIRKSGMEGFYANLLTKNVAMGNDVDKNAISVYTAGSIRQNHLLHTESTVATIANLDPSPTINKTNNMINSDDNKNDFSSSKIDNNNNNNDDNMNEIKKSSLNFNKEKYINTITSINLKSDTHDDDDDDHNESKLVLSKSRSNNHDDYNNEISLSTNDSNNSNVMVDETITKVEVILSARERYLERKRKNVESV